MPLYKMKDKSGKLIKKDGLQKYRVRINYVDDYGKSKQMDRVAFGLDEAKALERELQINIKQEQPTAKLTVGKLFEEYIKAKQYEIRETTLNKTQKTIEHYILPMLESVKLDNLNPPVLMKWKQSIEEQGLSIRTRKNIYSEFRTMLNFAVKMEYIPKNPLTKVGNFKAPIEPKKEMDFYTADEFLKFISAAKEYCTEQEKQGNIFAWSYYVFFCIAFYTGARKGEINALQWSDISNNAISITKSVTQKLKGEDRITPPKNQSSIRCIEIPEPLKEVLENHKTRLTQEEIFSEKKFICGGEKPLRDTNIEKMNKKFAEDAAIKKIRIHDFRHSHVSLLVQEGINIQEIARRLGHSNISITLETYSHLYPSETERAIKVLNNIKIV